MALITGISFVGAQQVPDSSSARRLQTQCTPKEKDMTDIPSRKMKNVFPATNLKGTTLLVIANRK